MKRILKEMRPFALIVLFIIGLLFFQAMTELALPDYMSRIVDVGIQQNGIEDTVPEAIRQDGIEKLKVFLNDEQDDILEDTYKLKSKEDLSQEDYEDYVEKYPLIQEEPLYILDESKEENIEQLNQFLGKAMLIVYGIESGAPQGVASEEMMDEDLFSKFPPGVDPFDVLENMPEEELEGIKSQIDKSFEVLPESMINQSAIQYIRAEYEAIGVDIEKTQSDYILYIGGIMLLIALIGMAASISVGFLAARVAASLGRNLREKMFTKVISFSNSEFNKFSTASLITRSTNDIEQIQTLMVPMLRIIFYAPILGIGGVIRALNTNTSMAWVVGIGVVAILIVVAVLFTFAIPKFKIVQQIVDKLNRVTRESLNGLMVIRAFNTQEYEEEKFDKTNKDLTKTNLFVSRLMVTMMPTMMLIMNLVIILIIWVGANEIDAGDMQVGDMMAFMQYAMQIIMSFLMISMVSIMLPRATVAAGRIGEVFDAELEITDPENPKELKDKKGLLQFNNVSFRYPGAEKCVLEDISFTANPGETTAFIGSTGSGKSSLIKLIPRFFDVTKGSITIDGIDIRDMRVKELREMIGYAPQNTLLFKGDIEGNIRYGKNADISERQVENAVDISQSREFIETKEEGLASPISQSGTNVSGGQKQRLSIARAIAGESQILIFDDSFSALDFKTDKQLRDSLKANVSNSTILTVAQRINTIKDAEKIIVLDDCKIACMGTHEELLENCDIYKQIALSQLSEEEL